MSVCRHSAPLLPKSVPSEATGKKIGQRVRRLRKEQRLSLRALAIKSGCSASLISQVELNQAAPSIASLERIAAGLGVRLGDFFSTAGAQSTAIVSRSKGPLFKRQQSNILVESLTPASVATWCQVHMITLRPGDWYEKAAQETDGERYVMVLDGTVRLELAGAPQLLRGGDGLIIGSGTSHRWENTRAKIARLLAIIAPLQKKQSEARPQ